MPSLLRPVLAALLAVAPVLSQAPVPSTATPDKGLADGLESPEEARAVVAGILKSDQQLRSILLSLNPRDWYEKKGAPSTYVVQWQAEQSQLNDLDVAARLYSQKVDDLTATLDFYFRLEALETTARALNEGAQRYAAGPVSEQLAQFVARNFDARQRFRDYLRELTVSVEQNFKIADQEAQRCRADQSKSPAPCPSMKRRG